MSSIRFETLRIWFLLSMIPSPDHVIHSIRDLISIYIAIIHSVSWNFPLRGHDLWYMLLLKNVRQQCFMSLMRKLCIILHCLKPLKLLIDLNRIAINIFLCQRKKKIHLHGLFYNWLHSNSFLFIFFSLLSYEFVRSKWIFSMIYQSN